METGILMIKISITNIKLLECYHGSFNSFYETRTSFNNSSRSRVGTNCPHNKAKSCCGSYFAPYVIVFVAVVDSNASELPKHTTKISLEKEKVNKGYFL